MVMVPRGHWGQAACRLTAQEAFVAIVPALFVGTLVMFGSSIVADGDPYWHIAAGEWIIRHGAVPHTDPFSYTFAGAPWTTHEWLSEVLMATAYRLAGMSGFYLLFGLATMATAFFLALELLRFLPPIPAFIVLQLAIAHVAEFIVGRPQY